jgi:hypothetical protein
MLEPDPEATIRAPQPVTDTANLDGPTIIIPRRPDPDTP